MTLEFVWPWVFILIPLPLLVHLLAPAVRHRNETALQVPDLELFSDSALANKRTNPFNVLIFLIAFLAWLLLISAAARPLWIGEPKEIGISGRDLMLAVDLSLSMRERDFVLNGRRIDRLSATKHVAGHFIKRRIGDRIGLILFGERAYLQTPLSFDRMTTNRLLQEAFLRLAGDNTAIGDAIGLAVKRLREQKQKNPVLILLSDGANTAGTVDPVDAAELAAKFDIRIYSIGIGADKMIRRSIFGNLAFNPGVDLDEETLTAIAEKTGGRYFRARNLDELNQIYAVIDELEPVETETQIFRPKRSLFYWPLGAAFILAFFLALFIRLHK